MYVPFHQKQLFDFNGSITVAAEEDPLLVVVVDTGCVVIFLYLSLA